MRYRAGLETRAKILDATRELLAEGGLDGATIKAICERADVRAGSFYNLFDSKEEAILTAVRQAITAVDPDPAGLGEEQIADLIEAYIRFVTAEPVLAKVYLRIAVGGGVSDQAIADRMLRHHRARVERFRDALLRADPHLPKEEAELDAEATLAAINGYALHSILDPTFDFAGHARRLIPA
ncbi:MAG: TetR/AcrR family transcriptional regulator [Acidimicrobiia bacterium]|nr:TetR/AcrR family transcriptional regulator [Acidimicrobiia bacterium]